MDKAPKKISNLYTKYSNLFPKNCISCEAGWYDIIEQMCGAIQVYIENEAPERHIEPKFVSIEEKFGILFIKIDGSDKVIDLVAKACEKLSCKTCEYCGEAGELYCSSKYRSWSNYKTLCLDHAIEFYYYRLYKETI